MEVLLRESVIKLGNRGEVVKVAPGYARNYLFPKKIAVPVTPGNKKQLETEKRNYEKRLLQSKMVAEEAKGKIDELTVDVHKRASDNGQLFGSVTAHEVAKLLHEKGFEVERRKMELPMIREVGEYEAKVRLHPEVTAVFKINVTRFD